MCGKRQEFKKSLPGSQTGETFCPARSAPDCLKTSLRTTFCPRDRLFLNADFLQRHRRPEYRAPRESERQHFWRRYDIADPRDPLARGANRNGEATMGRPGLTGPALSG